MVAASLIPAWGAKIVARLAAVCCVSLLAPLAVGLALLQPGAAPAPALSLLEQLGASPRCYSSALVSSGPILLTAALFLGPLVTLALECASGRGALPGNLAGQSSLRLVRAVVVAPLSEEWVFRACMAPLWRAQGAGHAQSVALCCACFGIVHAHHYREQVREGKPPSLALRIVALQVAYTALFAAIAAHAFQRSGSLLGAAASHALANALGLPSLAWLGRDHPLHWARAGIAGAYLAGIGAFAWLAGGGGGLWQGAPCALFPQP